MEVRLWSGALLCASLMIACQGDEEFKNSIKGHFEDSSQEKLEKYQGLQTVIPEYDETLGVIVGLPLITKHRREDLIESILDAGASKVWVTVKKEQDIPRDHTIFQELRQRIGERISHVETVPVSKDGEISVWSRDWAPLGAQAIVDSTGLKTLRYLDFNYYPRRPADDSFGRTVEVRFFQERVSIPVYNEGGNFMTNRRGDCMMTKQVIKRNETAHFDDDMILDQEAIEGYFQDYAGCKKVYIFEKMPYEGTGHIDLWAKYLDEDTVLVNEMRDETLKFIHPDAIEYRVAQETKNFLDERAKELTDLGFKVVRIPMPAPQDYDMFRSYTNSLVINGTAIVPQYIRGVKKAYDDESLLKSYEEEVEQVYARNGYRVVWIPSDSLIHEGGAIHCVTMQVPRI